jgi:iron(III) transport system permease protein
VVAVAGSLAAAVLVLPPLVWLVTAALRTLGEPAPGFLDPTAWSLLLRSLWLALLTSAGAVLLGLPFGWLTARFRLPGRRVLLAGSVLPLLLPPYCASLAWELLLTRDGPLNTALLGAGWIRGPLSVHGALPAAAAVLAFCYWPVVAWFTFLAARAVPRVLDDAARLHLPDAAAAAWTARPALWSAVPAGALLVFLLALADFGAPNTLGVTTYPVEIVNRFQLERDPGVVARFAGPLLLVVVPLVLLQLRLLARTALGPSGGERVGLIPFRRGAGAASAGCWLVLAVTILLPLAVLAGYSLPLTTYPAVWAESEDHFLNTLLTGGCAAMLAVVLAVTYGWCTLRRRGGALDLALTLSYALPASLLGVAMIQIMNRPGPLGTLYTSVGGLIWTYLALFFPFAHKSVQPAWERIDRELLDEGVVLGAGPVTQFLAVGWPVVRPYALAGGTIVGVLAAREIDATALLRIPDGDTIGFRIYDYLHFAPGPKVAALSVLLVLIGGAVVAGLAWWGRE